MEDKPIQNTYLGSLKTSTRVQRVRVKTSEGQSRGCSQRYSIKMGKENSKTLQSCIRIYTWNIKNLVDIIAKTFRNQKSTSQISKPDKHKNR